MPDDDVTDSVLKDMIFRFHLNVLSERLLSLGEDAYHKQTEWLDNCR